MGDENSNSQSLRLYESAEQPPKIAVCKMDDDDVMHVETREEYDHDYILVNGEKVHLSDSY